MYLPLSVSQSTTKLNLCFRTHTQQTQSERERERERERWGEGYIKRVLEFKHPIWICVQFYQRTQKGSLDGHRTNDQAFGLACLVWTLVSG